MKFNEFSRNSIFIDIIRAKISSRRNESKWKNNTSIWLVLKIYVNDSSLRDKKTFSEIVTIFHSRIKILSVVRLHRILHKLFLCWSMSIKYIPLHKLRNCINKFFANFKSIRKIFSLLRNLREQIAVNGFASTMSKEELVIRWKYSANKTCCNTLSEIMTTLIVP